MSTVYLGVGSNINAASNLTSGLDELHSLVQMQRISSVYWSEAVGFDGPPFLNLAVRGDTSLSLLQLQSTLREIELAYGRAPDASKFSSRHLDIDILCFDRLAGVIDGIQLPREETTLNAFVLAPMAEIAPNEILPGETLSLAALWASYAGNQQVERVEFNWHGKHLPWQGPSGRNQR